MSLKLAPFFAQFAEYLRSALHTYYHFPKQTIYYCSKKEVNNTWGKGVVRVEMLSQYTPCPAMVPCK